MSIAINAFQKISITAIFFIALIFISQSSNTFATEKTYFIRTWNSSSYTHESYIGKNFPIEKSVITASFEYIENGKQVNLNNTLITWLLNGKPLISGLNRQTVSFINKNFEGDNIILEAKMNRNGQDLSTIFEIKVNSPIAIIRNGNGLNTSNKILNYEAIPYFFNVGSISDLNYTWFVNNELIPPEENNDSPWRLQLIIPKKNNSRKKIITSLHILNPTNELETSKNETFNITQ